MDRLSRIRQELAAQGLDGMLVNQPENRRYLSGFNGSAGALLITAQEALLFTDFRYTEQAGAQAPQFQVIRHGQSIWETMAEHSQGLKTLAFEQNFITYEQYNLLLGKFSHCSLVPVSGLIEGLRSVKDDHELAALQQAADLADQAFEHILGYIQPGMSEAQIALELEFYMRQKGATGAAFDFIAASGVRSSLPHGTATQKKVAKGELLTLDFGAVVNGYCSDITRTVAIGEADAKQREVYTTVLEAQTTALAGIRPGITGKEADQLARGVISAKGYGENFGHGLGHGVGLAVHEEPRLSPAGEITLAPGMAVTVEPGIYLPGWGGVRIEDTVIITSQGCRTLTNSPKELIILR